MKQIKVFLKKNLQKSYLGTSWDRKMRMAVFCPIFAQFFTPSLGHRVSGLIIFTYYYHTYLFTHIYSLQFITGIIWHSNPFPDWKKFKDWLDVKIPYCCSKVIVNLKLPLKVQLSEEPRLVLNCHPSRLFRATTNRRTNRYVGSVIVS